MNIWRPIQTATAGLLSLMQLKNVGRNPDGLSDQVGPSLEMAGWWLRGSSVPFEFPATAMAAASEDFTIVTSGQREWRYLHRLGVGVSGAAAGTPVGRLLMIGPGGTPVIWGTPFQSASTVAGTKQLILDLVDVWLPPGFSIVFNIFDATVGDNVSGGFLQTIVEV